MDSRLETNRREMVELLKGLIIEEGLRPSHLPGVLLARVDRSHGRKAFLYEPNIYIVANGQKKGYVGQREFVYDSNNYLILAIPLPFDCETTVADGEPMLGVSVRLEVEVVREVSMSMGLRPVETPSEEMNGIAPTKLDAELSAATVHLLECLRSARDAAVLGPGRVRELIYRALHSSHAQVLLSMLGQNGKSTAIHASLRRMHARYFEPVNMAKLAHEAGMSVSAFHHHFKQLTGTSPLQYVKAVRLHRARTLIAGDGLGAAEAAGKVGYESPTQFHREFKRFFGHTPKQGNTRVRS